MTLALAVPITFAFIALVEVHLFRLWRVQGVISPKAARIMTGLTLAFPIVLYVLLAVVFPDIGAIAIF